MRAGRPRAVMNEIPFFKMSGSGNDFILIDNRRSVVPLEDPSDFAARICRRKMSVGADGLILLEASDRADFRWRFFNSDGSMAEMCGNGARCAARFAFLHGIAGAEMRFETLAGIIGARVQGDLVKIRMTDPCDLVLAGELDTGRERIVYSSINTGVPHVVVEVEDLEKVDVTSLGRRIRWHSRFSPAGTNVNFVAPLSDGGWAVRTYERGVEDETLACGTGIAAAALVLAAATSLTSPIRLKARSGTWLKVYFTRKADNFKGLFLEGDARIIYRGQLDPSAWEY
jgi:diaminopimelate epimerase